MNFRGIEVKAYVVYILEILGMIFRNHLTLERLRRLLPNRIHFNEVVIKLISIIREANIFAQYGNAVTYNNFFTNLSNSYALPACEINVSERFSRNESHIIYTLYIANLLR